MSYRDNLQPASFRGVPFWVETADTDFGRRNILHTYPFRDKPYSEDLGRKARVYTVSAYVGIDRTTDNYLPARDRLLQAIEGNSTPGTLVHPSLGSILVIPQDCRVRYSNQEGGIEYFDLTFTQAGENKYPDASNDSQSKVLTAGGTLKEKIIEQFTKTADTSQRTEYLRTEVTERGTDLITTLSTLSGNFTLSDGVGWNDAIATFTESLPTWVSDLPTYATQVVGLLDSVQTVYTRPQSSYGVYEGLLSYGDGLPAIPLTTSNRVQQASNREAHIRLVRRYAVTGMAETAAGIDFDSYNQAAALRDTLADRLDAEILLAGATDDDTVLFALEDVRAAMVADVTARGADLRRIRSIQVGDSIPAMVLAYDLYESDQSADVVARNKVIHPGFVPGGKPLEVLSA